MRSDLLRSDGEASVELTQLGRDSSEQLRNKKIASFWEGRKSQGEGFEALVRIPDTRE